MGLELNSSHKPDTSPCSFTGTSGTMAWELEEQGVHMVVMWSVPYNLNIYNSYFAIGVVQLTTKFSRDMLPYWSDTWIM